MQASTIERSVFINCPYDVAYRPLLDALVFSDVCCGFMPRSAIERRDTSAHRMERIARAMLESPFSIHDLSRCRGEGDANLARFNMPLELGMAMGFQLTRPGGHQWLALVPEGVAYAHYVSDLSGYDLETHNGTPERLVSPVVRWLVDRQGADILRKPVEVQRLLPVFNAGMADLRRDWDGPPPWRRVTEVALTIATR